ncbi:MAG: tRNA (adenosine(37)-N6)-dimethylallyltransferase MiaA [Candidatus Magasanikbacteria bacterium]
MTNENLPKIIVMLGPTAAGKTGWSLELAPEIEAEIISADSRQVYKYMDIGTNKPKGENQWFIGPGGTPQRAYFIKNIPHYLIDIIDPDRDFNLAKFQSKAKDRIDLILKKDKTPMLVGGSGLYIQSIVDNYQLPQIPPNENLRDALESFTNEQLVDILNKVDPTSAEKIEQNNTRRLIRAIEVSTSVGEPFSELKGSGDKLYDVIQIGVKVDRDELYEKINQRVEKMFDQGLKEEVAKLKDKYSWELSSMNSIGYQEFKPYFEGEVELKQVKENIKTNTRNYAKRQLSWFKRFDRINWCESLAQAKKKIDNFLNK